MKSLGLQPMGIWNTLKIKSSFPSLFMCQPLQSLGSKKIENFLPSQKGGGFFYKPPEIYSPTFYEKVFKNWQSKIKHEYWGVMQNLIIQTERIGGFFIFFLNVPLGESGVWGCLSTLLGQNFHNPMVKFFK